MKGQGGTKAQSVQVNNFEKVPFVNTFIKEYSGVLNSCSPTFINKSDFFFENVDEEKKSKNDCNAKIDVKMY